MSEYDVILPIAGHSVTTVEADDEESAIQKAIENLSSEHFEGCDVFGCFQGNLCLRPSTRDAAAINIGDDDSDDASLNEGEEIENE